MAFVAVAVALSLLARAGRIEAAGAPSQKFRVLGNVTLQSNARGSVTVNQALNKIYVSGNPSDNCDIAVNVIDGVTFAITDVGYPFDYGSGVSVDNKTNRYWAADIYGNGPFSGICPPPHPPYPPGVIVRDDTNTVVTTVPIPGGVCPIQTNYDFFKNRVWASAQCGAFHDPIFAVDASTYAITAGPIDSGGIMGPIVANGANGRLYFTDQDGGSGPYISKRVNPTTFAVTPNAFGKVVAINALTNKLYAVPEGTSNLQIINGAPDPEVVLKTITLPYAPSGFGINTALNYLYIANPAGNSLEVRDGSTGALIATFPQLPAPPNGSIAVDSIRGRIYVISYGASTKLMVIEDLINAFKPGAIISHF
jgi:DNA-binding beta-propeller fold protein YncE